MNECSHLTLFCIQKYKVFLVPLARRNFLDSYNNLKALENSHKIIIFIFTSLIIKKMVFHCFNLLTEKEKNQNRLYCTTNEAKFR